MAASPDIAHTIQLSLAPVFLLAGIAGFLNVLAQRLSRAVDRARVVETEFTPADDPRHDRQVGELRMLDRRIAIGSSALFLCTASAVLICAVVAGLFVARLSHHGSGLVMAGGFIAAMLLLIAGLTLFLVEVGLSLRSIRIREELLEQEAVERRRWLRRTVAPKSHAARPPHRS